MSVVLTTVPDVNKCLEKIILPVLPRCKEEGGVEEDGVGAARGGLLQDQGHLHRSGHGTCIVDSRSEPDSHVCEGKQFICLKGLLAFTLAQRFRDTIL